MPESRIVNASPLITLAKIGRLDLLALDCEITIPDAVAAEVMAGPATDPARNMLANGFGARGTPNQIPAAVLEWSLGAGESAVLAIALEQHGAIAVLDDAEARTCARALGVPVLGTVGVVLRSRKRGSISSASAVLHELKRAGLFLDDKLLQRVLPTVGEEWIPT